MRFPITFFLFFSFTSVGCMQSYILSRGTYSSDKEKIRHSKQVQRLFYLLPGSAIDSRQETLYTQGKLGITTERELEHILKQTSNEHPRIRSIAAWSLEYIDTEYFDEQRRWEIIEHICIQLQEESTIESITMQAKTISRLLTTIQATTQQKIFILNTIDEQIYKLPVNNVPIILLLIKKHIQTPSVILKISEDILGESSWDNYHFSRITDILQYLQLQEPTVSHLDIYKNLMRIYDRSEHVLRVSILQSLTKHRFHKDDLQYIQHEFSQHLQNVSNSKIKISSQQELEWALILRWFIGSMQTPLSQKTIKTALRGNPERTRKLSNILFHKQEYWALQNIWSIP